MKNFLPQRNAFAQATFTKNLFSVILLFSLSFYGSKSYAAPISGTFTIPGGTYATIASAIAALNSNGVTSPGVTFNVTAGYTETFATPTTGWINTPGSSTAPIVFVKSGAGADPLIKTIGTSGGDAGILLEGVSYITIDGIDVQDNGISVANYVEYGIALINYNGSTNVGCQHDTIRNCTITLTAADNDDVSNGSSYLYNYDNQLYTTIGIYQTYDNTAFTGATESAMTPAGTNSYNSYYKNTVNNAGIGIALYCLPISFNTDFNNDIGTKGANIIANAGPREAQAIFLYDQSNCRVTGNNISVSSTLPAYNAINGIYAYGGSAVEIDHNTISVANSGDNSQGNIITSAGIYLDYTDGGTLKVHDNVIQNSSISYRNFNSITVNGPGNPLTIYNNTISNNASLSTNSITITGIALTTSASSTVSIYNNQIFSNSSPLACTGIANSAASGTSNIYNNQIFSNSSSATCTGITNSPTSGTTNVFSNKIYSLTGTGTSGVAWGINATGGATQTIYNNFIANLTAAGNSIYGASITTTVPLEFYYNSIYLNQTTGGTATTFNPVGVINFNGTAGNALDMRDNLVVTTSTPGSGSWNIGIEQSSGAAPYAGYASTSDYNCWYAGTPSASNVLLWSTSGNAQTIAAFQGIMTGRDAHSISINPGFTSATDLHKTNMTTYLPLVAGELISSITTDIDGDNRGSTVTCIGADEFCTAAPVITTPPASTRICPTATATFTYAANGLTSPSTIQWNENGGSITNGGVYSGANSSTLTLTSPTYALDGKNYTVTLTSSCGTTTSSAGVLSIGPSSSVISTFPGSTSLAAVNQPYGMTVDASGNVYVANYNSGIVNKITPAGVFTTFLTSPGDGPVGLCVDPTFPTSGNMYMSDWNNNTIYKVSSTGVPTVYCSTGLNGPESLARDASGNLYVWDYGSYRVLKVNTSGIASAFAGTSGASGNTGDNGPALSCKFAGGGEGELAVDASNNVYIVDESNNRVRMVAGTTAGGHTIGYIYAYPGATTFNVPGGIKVDPNGNVYISERNTNKVWKVNNASVISLYAGTGTASFSGDGGPALSATMSSPYGLALDVSNNLYVSDVNNNRVREIISAPAQPAAPTGTATICQGTVSGTYTTTGSVDATSYTWTVTAAAGTISGTGTTATVTWNATYSGTATISVAANSSCANTSSPASTLSVTVNPLPTITLVVSSPAVCFSTSSQTANITYSGTTSSPNQYSISAWSSVFTAVPNTALTSPIAVTVPASAAVGTYTATLNVTNTTTTCVSGNYAISVTVNATPTISTTPIGNAYSCGGGNTTIVASGSSTSYKWSPSTGLSATTGASVNASPVSTQTYTVLGTDVNSCTNSATVVCNALPLLSGTYTIDNQIAASSTNFISFTSAVAALNCLSGNVTFNVIAGETFTEAPVISTFTNPGNYHIIFQKSIGSHGNADPKLEVTGVGNTDAAFTITGGNNFTFNGIDFADNPTNSTQTTYLEYGLLLQGTSANGCTGNTYENGVITLNTLNSGVSTYDVYVLSAATSSGTANSNNNFYNNTVSGGTYGYYFFGNSTYYDQNNQVGILTGGTSNITGLKTGAFRGISYDYQQGFNAFNNNIYGLTNNSATFGLAIAGGVGLTTSSNTANIYNNVIGGSAGLAVTGISTGQTDGIYFPNGGNANIYGNTIMLSNTTNTGPLVGLVPAPNVSGSITNMYNNVIGPLTSNQNTGVIGIEPSEPASVASTTMNIYGNTISSLTGGAGGNVGGIYPLAPGGAASQVYNVYNNIFSSISIASNTLVALFFNIPGTISIYGNTISGVTGTTGQVYGIDCSQTGTVSISNNVISSITSTTAPLYGIWVQAATAGSTIFGNTVSTLTATGAATAVYGINITGGNFSNIYGNSVSGISCSSAAATSTPVAGINYTNATASTTNNIYSNAINGVNISATTSTGQASGMVIAGAVTTSTDNIYKNVINNINNSSTTATGTAVGLQISATGTNNTYDNYIYDVRANSGTLTTSGGAVKGLYISASATSNKVYYNSIYLYGVAPGAVNQVSTAFYALTEAGANALDYRNNIFVNNYTISTGATCFTYAFWYGTNTYAGITASSNYNLLYVGSNTTHNFIFNNGTNKYQSLLAYQGAATSYAPRDANAHTFTGANLNTFFSLAATPHYLDLLSTATDAIGNGIAIASPYNVDIYGVARSVGTTPCGPTIGGDEITAPTAPTVPSGSLTLCQASANTNYTTSSTNAATYNWSISGAGASTIAGTGTTGTVTWSPAFFGTATITVSATNSCNTSPSTSVNVVVNPGPIVIISGTLSGCASVGVPLGTTGSSAGSGTITGYQWANSGGNIVGATTSTYTATSSSSYTVVISNSIGCSITSAASVVTVNANPTATITGTLTGCVNPGVALSAASSVAGSGTIPASGYQWANAGGNIVGATNSTYTAPSSGNYTVVVTNSNNCTAGSSASSVTALQSASFITSIPGTIPTTLNYGLAIDASGNVFEADWSNSKIYKITPAGVVTTFTSNISNPLINGPVGIAFDGGSNLYVTEDNLDHITKITTAGSISDFVTLPNPGFGCAEGIAIDATGTNLYVSMYCTYVIYKINIATKAITTIAGTYGTSGNTGDGNPGASATIGTSGSGLEEVAVDANNNVYIADPGNHRVRIIAGVSTARFPVVGDIYNFAGSSTGVSGNSGDGGPATSALLSNPSGVRLDAGGNVYIADGVNHNVRVVNPAGIISTFVNTSAISGNTGDGGIATAATLSQPYGLAFDAPGNLYIDDELNTRIREVYASLIPALNGSVTSICQGTATSVFTATSAGATSYNWSVTAAAGSVSGTGTSATVTWNATYTGTATVSVTATNGCGNTPASTLPVVVTPNTLPAPSTPSGVTSRCVGAGTNTYTSSLVAGATTYIWSVTAATGSISGTGTSATVTWASTYTGTATVSITASNGCVNSPSSVAVVTYPTLSSPTLPSGPSSRCNGSGTSVYTVAPVSGATSYNWSVSGAGNTIAGTSTSATVTWSAGYSGVSTVSVAPTNPGCGTGPSSGLFVFVNPPLSGTYTIDNTVSGIANLFPNTTVFNSIASAIAQLNSACGIAAPGVTFLVKAGMVETFATSTAGWINLPSINTSATPIVFKKNGAGADPLIKAIGTANGDAGILLEGVSYVTIDGIDVFDNGTSFSNYVEYGISLVFSTHACSHDTVRNCTVTLNTADNWANGGAYINGTNYYTTIGIYQSYDNGALGSSELTGYPNGTFPGGPPSNSFNAYTGNTVLGAGFGIMVVGTPPAGTYETNIYVANNTFGTIANPIGPVEGTGIFVQYENNFRATNNTIYLSATQVAADANYDGVYGIYINNGAATQEFDHNTITTSSNGFLDSPLDPNCAGIGFAGSATGPINIHDNTITNSVIAYRNFSGILDNGTAVPMSIYDNTISNNSANSNLASSSVTGIAATSGAGGTMSVYNNQVSSNSTTTTNTGLSLGLNGITIGNGSGTSSVYNNKIFTMTTTGSNTSFVVGLAVTGGSAASVYNNFITDYHSSGYNITGASISTTGSAKFYYNSININQTTVPASGFMESFGLYLANPSTNPADIRNNIVINNSVTGTGNAIALFSLGSGTPVNSYDGYATTSNNNDYYAGTPGPLHLIFQKSNANPISFQTLLGAGSFSAASGRDLQSISVNPGFTSATDLHKTNMTTYLPLIAGQVIAGFITDIDGDTRNTITPDIGADEFVTCPVINTQPSVPAAVCSGAGVATFTVASLGTPAFNYQWKENGNTITNGGVYSGATTATLTLTNATTALSGNNYSVVVSNTCGNTTSSSVALTVNPIPVGSASPQTICSGQTTNIGLSSTVGGTTYTWTAAQLSGATVTGFGNCSSSCGNTIAQTLSNTNASAGVARYTVSLTANSCIGTPFTADATVNPLPTITIAPSSGNICLNDILPQTASGASDYSWSPSAGLDVNTGASVNASPTVSTTYTVLGTSAAGCTNTTMDAITVRSLPPLVVTPNNAVCPGATSAALVASGAATYSWAPNTDINTTTGAIVTVQISTLTFYTVTGTGANLCTANIVVPVATVAIAGTVTPSTSIICSGGTKLLTSSGSAGHDYQWQISSDNVNWTNIVGATNTSYTTTSGNGTIIKYYRIEANSNACWNVASNTAIVDVSNPAIAVTTTNITDQAITLNWTPVGSGNYTVSWSGASAGSSTNATPPKTITGLTPGGTYSITVTQTGTSLTGCPASGTVALVTTLCSAPTGVTATTPSLHQMNVSWTGGAGNYRVFYRPLYSSNAYFTKDVTGATSATITRMGSNILPASTTYEVYVSMLDCPTTGIVGQPSSKIYVTTPPALACLVPTIDSVKSTCPIQIEVWMHPSSSPTGIYQIYFQRLTPTIQGVVSYQVNGNYFTVNIGSAGQTYLITAASNCGSGVYSNLYIWPGNVTVKPLCSTINNLVLSNPTCHGFTASWNIDQCLSNNVSYYQIYLRLKGNVNWNSYPVTPVPPAPIGPYKLINWLGKGAIYQVFIQSVYSCNGYNTTGPSSQTITDTTLSAGCKDDDQEVAPDQSTVQQYSQDKSEVLNIYPNPNNGEFMLDISRLSDNEDKVRVEVMNMLGQTVMTDLTGISGGHLTEFIRLPNTTASGNYFVRVTVGNNIYTTKINISR